MKSRPASRRGALDSPRYLEIAPDGSVIVCDEGADAVIRIDATSGAQTPLTSGGLISSCEGLALRSNGQLLATDRTNDWLLKHDPVAGVLPSPFTLGGAFGELHDALPDGPDHVLVVDGGTSEIYRIDLANGTRELFSTGQLLINPRGLSRATDGNILVMDLTRRLIEVDVTLPPSANQSQFLVNTPDIQPLGLTVVPEPAVTIMLASALILLVVFDRRHARRP